jgi:eukaryotic-like serine/threonine-protein kinase
MRLGHVGPLLLVLLAPLAWPRASAAIPTDPLPPGTTARLGGGRGAAAVLALAVAPDGAAVAVARGPAVGLFRPDGAALRTLAAHRQAVTLIAFAPTGESLATAAAPGDPAPLRLWDPATGEMLRRWGDAGRRVRAIDFTPDGTLVILEPDAVTLNNPRLGRFSGALPLPPGDPDPCHLALSPDGRTLVAGSGKAERMVWDLTTRRLLRSGPAPGPCRGLYFLPDGRRVVWVDGDEVRVWAAAAAAAPAPPFAADCLRDVTAMAVTRDGRLLALAQGREVSVWEVSSRQRVLRRDGHRDTVRALAFTPDGHALVSGGDDGEAFVWDLSGR